MWPPNLQKQHANVHRKIWDLNMTGLVRPLLEVDMVALCTDHSHVNILFLLTQASQKEGRNNKMEKEAEPMQQHCFT